MLDALKPFIGPIVVFGLVIFVHELGHFIAAKLMGVYAPRFSIGFGPALWRRRWGETEYILAALPLGGYVRMASREDEATAFLEGGSEEGNAARRTPDTVGAGGVGKVFEEEEVAPTPDDWDPEAMIPFGPKPVPAHRWFESKSLPARLFILLAGVTMNVLLALVIMVGYYAGYGRETLATTVIGSIDAPAGAERVAELLRVGDTIVAIDGQPVRTWNDVNRALIRSGPREVAFATHRGEIRVPIGGVGEPTHEQVAFSVQPLMPAVVGRALPGSPAHAAGLQRGDSVIAVEGHRILGFQQMVEHVSPAAGRPTAFEIVRAGVPLTVTIVPDSTRERDASGTTRVVGRIGVVPADPVVREPVGAGEAITMGWNETWGMSSLIFDALNRLVRREVSVDQLGGPVAIVQLSAEAAQAGLRQFLYLIALLSVNIAIFNLLPIPILDGGQILINLLEAAKGSSFSVRTREYILRAGLVTIALIFVLVMFNDIRRLLRSFF